jgi:branched-chain amino acid aminotransferase
MEFAIHPVPQEERRPKPRQEEPLGFGRHFSDHMFTMNWTAAQGWQDPMVRRYESFYLNPSSLVFHYGQSILEGLKAYRTPRGSINLFRPRENARRFNQSAARLALPPVDEEVFLAAIESLLRLDREWIPQAPGASLYIRPTLIATEPCLGVRAADEALFFIIAGPVGAYYPQGFDPVRISVCRKYSRASPGGLGAVKAGGNYAASLLAAREAAEAGYTQVLWLDALQSRYVEEVGAMNILFKIGGEVLSPPFGDTILAGITPDSAMTLLRDWGIPVTQRPIAIDEVLASQADGSLEEIFGAGTAAVIAPVGVLEYQGRDYTVADGSTGPLARRLHGALTGIQYGREPDPHDWVHEVIP